MSINTADSLGDGLYTFKPRFVLEQDGTVRFIPIPTGRCQEQSIGRPKHRAPDVTAQDHQLMDHQLMTKHDDLKVFRLGGSPPKHHKSQNALKDAENA
jgi:hypothetical protein